VDKQLHRGLAHHKRQGKIQLHRFKKIKGKERKERGKTLRASLLAWER